MKRLVWVLDIAGVLEADGSRKPKEVRLPNAAPLDVLGVLKALSDLCYHDGGTHATAETVAAKSGVRADMTCEILADLLRLGVFQLRTTNDGRSLLEPSAAIMQVYRLAGWSELPQHH
jgi:hypothetical protein